MCTVYTRDQHQCFAGNSPSGRANAAVTCSQNVRPLHSTEKGSTHQEVFAIWRWRQMHSSSKQMRMNARRQSRHRRRRCGSSSPGRENDANPSQGTACSLHIPSSSEKKKETAYTQLYRTINFVHCSWRVGRFIEQDARPRGETEGLLRGLQISLRHRVMRKPGTWTYHSILVEAHPTTHMTAISPSPISMAQYSRISTAPVENYAFHWYPSALRSSVWHWQHTRSLSSNSRFGRLRGRSTGIISC